MKASLVSLLTGESSISSLVSSRVYVNTAPQKATFPHIILTQMGSDEFSSLDGLSGRLRFIDFDIDCKARTSVGATALGNAVRKFLDDYTGTAGSETIGAVTLNSESDDYEPPTDGSDIGVFTVTLDVTIQFNTVSP